MIRPGGRGHVFTHFTIKFMNMKTLTRWLLVAACVLPLSAAEPAARWSPAKANAWYASIDWPVGANFVPSTAINQLEMWQADTFDPDTIDRELGRAAAIGMNTMRVFLHDLTDSGIHSIDRL